MGAPVTDEFFRRVSAAAEGTPYVVRRTAEGFDLSLDVADAQWYGLFNKAGLSKTFVNHVKVTDDSFTITDDSKELRWEAGHPKVAGSATRTRGRTIEIGREKIWAIREDGTVGPVVDYRLDSEEGRELVTMIGRDLGLTPRRGTEERIGLYAAVGAIGLILLVGLVALLDAFVL